MNRIGILVIFVVLTLIACSNSDSESGSYMFSSSTSIFVKEADTASSYYRTAKKWERELQLPDIENGYEGFQMRLWYYPEFLLRKKLMIVKHSAGDWSAKAFRLTIDRDNGTGIVAVDSVLALTPKSGWRSFQNKLAELMIRQLPNYNYVQGDELVDDGITYFTEVANQKSYWLSWFSNPQQNVKNNKSAQQWQSVVDLFRQEFDVSN
jgi:hypothetical protein